jgi:hypothetical protein
VKLKEQFMNSRRVEVELGKQLQRSRDPEQFHIRGYEREPEISFSESDDSDDEKQKFGRTSIPHSKLARENRTLSWRAVSSESKFSTSSENKTWTGLKILVNRDVLCLET